MKNDCKLVLFVNKDEVLLIEIIQSIKILREKERLFRKCCVFSVLHHRFRSLVFMCEKETLVILINYYILNSQYSGLVNIRCAGYCHHIKR